MSSNHISKVAIVGATGHSGSFMTKYLLQTGKHTITAITRHDSPSTSNIPEGVQVKTVDYEKPETIVEALRGQEVLVITLSGRAPYKEIEAKLVRAAAEAGVPWILPNDWSPDSTHEGTVKDVPLFQAKLDTRKNIEDLGKSSYIGVECGFWYEWMIPTETAFGFDLINHKVTLFDEGETKISLSTWPQLGKAVAALLSLPINAEGADKSACLDAMRNKVVYINSFTVNQKEMLASAMRVSGTTEKDWTITKQPSQERYDEGAAELKAGNFMGMFKTMSTRIFFLDGCGDFEKRKGTINNILGLEKQDIDEFTAIAFERAKNPAW